MLVPVPNPGKSWPRTGRQNMTHTMQMYANVPYGVVRRNPIFGPKKKTNKQPSD